MLGLSANRRIPLCSCESPNASAGILLFVLAVVLAEKRPCCLAFTL
jgi:hypothetical protein